MPQLWACAGLERLVLFLLPQVFLPRLLRLPLLMPWVIRVQLLWLLFWPRLILWGHGGPARHVGAGSAAVGARARN